MPDNTPGDDAQTRRAVRFFWSTLIAATGASVAGNIAHAVLVSLLPTTIPSTHHCSVNIARTARGL